MFPGESFGSPEEIPTTSPSNIAPDSNLESETSEKSPSEAIKPRTVSEFYREIATDIKDNNVHEGIINEQTNISNTEQALQEISRKERVVSNEKDNTKPFDFGRKRELKEENEALARERSTLIGSLDSSFDNIKDLRSTGETYTGKTSNEDFIRATNPTRLEEIAKANEPLPGHEAPVRFIDLTPEMREERRAQVEKQKTLRELGYDTTMPIPEVKKEIVDPVVEQKEYSEKAVEVLTETIINRMNADNGNKLKTEVPWEMDRDSIKSISKSVYEKSEGLYISDLQEGFTSISRKKYALENKSPLSDDEVIELGWLSSRAEKIKAVEEEILSKMSILQIGNEVAELAGVQNINTDRFISTVARMEQKIAREKKSGFSLVNSGQGIRYAEEIEYCKKSRNIKDRRIGDANENSNFFSDKLFGTVVYDVRDFLGYNSISQITTENLPEIMGYFAARLEQGSGSTGINEENMGFAIEHVLNHAFTNSSPEGTYTRFSTELRKKYRDVPIGRYNFSINSYIAHRHSPRIMWRCNTNTAVALRTIYNRA